MAVDSLGFLDAVEGLPEQLGDAHRAAAALDLSVLEGRDIANVVVCGMGGSGIAGDVLAAVANGTLAVPVTVLKQYRVPAFVDERTLVFACSYSGGTEETLSMAEGAVDAGGALVAISEGGELAELARIRGGVHVPCPPGFLPRAALGALVAPLFVVLFRLGMLDDAHQWLVDAERQLTARRDRCRRAVEGPVNPARELARRIGRSVPLVYGGGALGAVGAYRWKCDVNENAKAPAFWHAFPELDHNEICGWGVNGDATRQLVTLVQLRHDFEHERLVPRFAATREIIEEALMQVLEVRAEGEGRLAQVLDLMYLGDFTSCYLALDQDVDPGPIAAIADLKARLAGDPP